MLDETRKHSRHVTNQCSMGPAAHQGSKACTAWLYDEYEYILGTYRILIIVGRKVEILLRCIAEHVFTPGSVVTI